MKIRSKPGFLFLAATLAVSACSNNQMTGGVISAPLESYVQEEMKNISTVNEEQIIHNKPKDAIGRKKMEAYGSWLQCPYT